MLLATTQVEDFDRFLEIFSTTGADKRKEHGSKSALIFRDPSEDDRVWVIFDWDEQGWQSFVSDPEVPPIMKEAGHKGPPQAAELGGVQQQGAGGDRVGRHQAAQAPNREGASDRPAATVREPVEVRPEQRRHDREREHGQGQE